MGEAAARMAGTGGVDSIICMGVDFMAESVRATLDSNNFQVHHTFNSRVWSIHPLV